jgi:trehalose 6-phosphate synthase/phosphatase
MASAIDKNSILLSYSRAKRRILFLDYDGTLVPFRDHPDSSDLELQTRSIIRNLANNRKNQVFIISGRVKEFLVKQFDGVPVGLIAEHGFLLRRKEEIWKQVIPLDISWKQDAIELLRKISERYPGTFVEEKESAVTFHYRTAVDVSENDLIHSIREGFGKFVEQNAGLELLAGNKVAEIKSVNCNKGLTARRIIDSGDFDFILAAGDDASDEQLFAGMPAGAVTIKVGNDATQAGYFIDDRNELIRLLEEMEKPYA